LYAELYGVLQVGSRVAELLDQVGVGRLANEQVGRLSRGQQQRVALARALLHDPRVLLLDEPDTGLDVGAFEMLERLLVESHRTVVLTTHNLASGIRLGTRAAVLARGRLVDEHKTLTGADAGELSTLLEGLARG
jgi:ABC-type multidrug transport system ATPase subunit